MTTTAVVPGVPVTELISAVLQDLVKRFQGKEIKLEKPVEVMIADDSDGHRHRHGYMQYQSYFLVTVDGRKWLLGVGKKTGSYPGDQYACDLFAKPLADNVKVSDIASPDSDIYPGGWFENSVLIGMASGQLAAREEKAVAALSSITMKDVIIQDAETNPDLIAANTLAPVVTRQAMYKPEAAAMFAEAIGQHLSRLG